MEAPAIEHTDNISIRTPRWRCEEGHETDTTIKFTIAGEDQEDFCAICWQRWMRAQGWRATRVEEEVNG